MRCCSNRCKKISECGFHYSNSFGIHQVEDFSCYGSGGLLDEGNWWCGELGDYKMFEPIKLTQEEFVALHCNVCGYQKCEGIGTEWLNECKFKDHLKTNF